MNIKAQTRALKPIKIPPLSLPQCQCPWEGTSSNYLLFLLCSSAS